MKVGDIVQVADGSWSMSLISGSLKHVYGDSLIARRYRVLCIGGEYPTHDRDDRGIKRNDIMLVDVNDSDHVLFTQQAFCRVVTPVPSAPHDTVDLTIPSGVTTVKLHFED